MSGYKVTRTAKRDLREIHHFTEARWGEAQADGYLQGLFALFARIGEGAAPSRPIPVHLSAEGRVSAYRRHHVYWNVLPNGVVSIRTVLHQRMLAAERLRDVFARPD